MSPNMKSILLHLLLIGVGAAAVAIIAQLANYDFGPYQAIVTVVLSTLADAAKSLIAKNTLAAKN